MWTIRLVVHSFVLQSPRLTGILFFYRPEIAARRVLSCLLFLLVGVLFAIAIVVTKHLFFFKAETGDWKILCDDYLVMVWRIHTILQENEALNWKKHPTKNKISYTLCIYYNLLENLKSFPEIKTLGKLKKFLFFRHTEQKLSCNSKAVSISRDISAQFPVCSVNRRKRSWCLRKM